MTADIKQNPWHVSKDRGTAERFQHLEWEGGIWITSSNWRSQTKEKQGVHMHMRYTYVFWRTGSSPLLSHPPSYAGAQHVCVVYVVSKNTVNSYSVVLLFTGADRDFTYLSCTPTPQNRKAAKTCSASGLKRKVEAAKTVKVCREFLKCSPTAGCLSTWSTSCGEDQQQLPLVAILTCKTRVSL